MKNDDEKPLDLRDQFAMSIIGCLLTNTSIGHHYINNISSKIDNDDLGRAERIAIVAYKMADEMRKVRLQSFK